MRVGRGGLAGVVALGAILLVAPLAAGQAPQPVRPGANGDETCAGHLSAGKASEGVNPVDYQFACPDKLTGYALVVNREVTGFDANVSVFQADGTTIVPSDSFGCEGSVPGFGANCDGTYSGNFNVVKGTLQLTAPLCARPASTAKARGKHARARKGTRHIAAPVKLSVQLVVTYAGGTADSTGKVTVTQSVAGPFNLPLHHHCKG